MSLTGEAIGGQHTISSDSAGHVCSLQAMIAAPTLAKPERAVGHHPGTCPIVHCGEE
jgi:hypothetical protein